MAETQNSLIGKVVAFFNANGYYCWRQENYGRFDTAEAQEQLVRLVGVLRSQPHISDKQVADAVAAVLKRCWRKVPGSELGIPDILGFNLSTGRMLLAEIKIGTDKLSAEQERLLRRAHGAKTEVHLVREYESFVDSFWRKRAAARVA